MAVPKKKTSRSRRDRRRGNPAKRHTTDAYTTCPSCNELVRPHRLCSTGTDCQGYAERKAKKKA